VWKAGCINGRFAYKAVFKIKPVVLKIMHGFKTKVMLDYIKYNFPIVAFE